MKTRSAKLIALFFCCAGLALAQQPPKTSGVVGTWHLVRIDLPGPDGKPAAPTDAPQPAGMLIYTADGHAAVQLMYPQTTLSDEFVHDGYEATFGGYEVDESKHQLTYHIQASATRAKLVGTSENLLFEFPDAHHMIIRPALTSEHWFVTWERY